MSDDDDSEGAAAPHEPLEARAEPLEPRARFEILTRLNPPELRPMAGRRGRLDPRFSRIFDGPSRVDRFVRELVERRALRTKELCESFEVFQRVRRALRGGVVADLCCGHGLVGLCFAVFEPEIERVLLLDLHQPQNHAACFEAACAVAPWVREKVEYRTGNLQYAHAWLPPNAGVVAVHACGTRSDQVLDLAMPTARGVALVPCCYPDKHVAGAPAALVTRLGTEMATDIHRTYRLTNAGFTVRFGAIPPEITPMNRVLLAERAG